MLTDQRGFAVFGDQRDIGAFEYQDTCTIVSSEEISLPQQESKVYPNPTFDKQVTVEISATFGTEVEIRVFEFGTGKLLSIQQANSNNQVVNFKQLPAGTYLLQVISQDKIESHKVILGE